VQNAEETSSKSIQPGRPADYYLIIRRGTDRMPALIGMPYKSLLVCHLCLSCVDGRLLAKLLTKKGRYREGEEGQTG
jgi:hypothetical protein